MSFIQDPRLRQRWNQISHNAEAVTENAVAGIWTFQHRYIHPCLAGVGNALDSCTSVCLGGDREERARRARERDRGARRTRAEYTFDFYDDWDEADDEGPGGGGLGRGLLGSWSGTRSEDWDRLLAGSGTSGANDALADQPRRKRGMSYGTRGVGGVRKASGEEDPNVIPRTAPLGFLGRLPFNIGGTLRYKPSAANLQDHPGGPTHAGGGDGGGGHGEENEPLLGTSEDEEQDVHRRLERSPQYRPRSNTVESGDTSSSYRSRGDLFPSDGEGDEDAVALDDEFTMALSRVDNDRSSNKTRSSKGKRRADMDMSRTVSRTTMSSGHTPDSRRGSSNHTPLSFPVLEDRVESPAPLTIPTPSLEDLEQEEAQAAREELEEIERRRVAASKLALQRGLSKDDLTTAPGLLPAATETQEDKYGEAEPEHDEIFEEPKPNHLGIVPAELAVRDVKAKAIDEGQFIPARLPYFG
ncbi:hypothetical protein B0T26DRAFT_639969 [Lasiosphaeria miniovina]|uniref:Uncharacterized protein n=1 Tax=Lasiosphaeria miniovina TaxID=1954250 RepID=A0AA40E5M4_9PEZI|nr:uncharacterized protein B0T26DRAFT_639969 [Lasiosphaeria miniovina]KAK0728015.1 hypothetical protein B0T26DRAFT_639969 [Lasiosphaeria miniovina]